MPDPRAAGANRRAPLVLAFDTAGSACSVAVGRDGIAIARERKEMRHGHAEALLPMIDRVMDRAALAPAAIDIVVVTVGPGGFTGIRAGLAAAHGLALASNARLAGVSSFAAVAAIAPESNVRLLVAIDSRRDDLYVQLFDATGAPAGEPEALPQEQLRAWVGGQPIRIAGDADRLAAAALHEHPFVEILPGTAPDARGALAVLHRWPDLADPLARPLYLRPPDVSFPKARAGLGDIA